MTAAEIREALVLQDPDTFAEERLAAHRQAMADGSWPEGQDINMGTGKSTRSYVAILEKLSNMLEADKDCGGIFLDFSDPIVSAPENGGIRAKYLLKLRRLATDLGLNGGKLRIGATTMPHNAIRMTVD